MGWLLYDQLFVQHNIEELLSQVNSSLKKKGSWLLLLGVAILMPLNWLIESLKWRILVKQFQKFTLKQSILSILSGVSLAIMTPGRIGEYGGRLIGIKPKNRPSAIMANLISSLSQNIINIGLGLLMALMFMNTYFQIEKSVFLSLLFISTLIVCALMLAYFRIDLLKGLIDYLPKHKWITKIQHSLSNFQTLENPLLWKILGISAFRYSIYMFQYVLLIHFFGVTNLILPSILGVGTIFFLQSNLPLPPILSVMARGEMAIFLWSVFTDNVLGIVAATFSLWTINLVIPSILGAVVIARSKLT